MFFLNVYILYYIIYKKIKKKVSGVKKSYAGLSSRMRPVVERGSNSSFLRLTVSGWGVGDRETDRVRRMTEREDQTDRQTERGKQRQRESQREIDRKTDR